MSTLNAKFISNITLLELTHRISTPNIKYAHRILKLHPILNMHTDSNNQANLKPINLKLIIIINYINEGSREEELRANPIKINKH